MRHWKLTQWCSYAAAQIRYGPDREAVHDELKQHLDDRSDGFLARGLTEEDSITKTLDAMGDPHELAPILAAIHKPFWGYAQDVCKWVFRIAVYVTIWFSIWYTVNYSQVCFYEEPAENGWFWSPENHGIDVTTIPHDISGPSCSDSGYALTLTKARTLFYSDGYPGSLSFQLEVCASLPWQEMPAISSLLWAEDSAGNRYATYWEGSYTGNAQVYPAPYHTAPLTWVLEGQLIDFSLTGIDWVDIHYSRDGRDMVWRIDLTGGEGA